VADGTARHMKVFMCPPRNGSPVERAAEDMVQVEEAEEEEQTRGVNAEGKLTKGMGGDGGGDGEGVAGGDPPGFPFIIPLEMGPVHVRRFVGVQ